MDYDYSEKFYWFIIFSVVFIFILELGADIQVCKYLLIPFNRLTNKLEGGFNFK